MGNWKMEKIKKTVLFLSMALILAVLPAHGSQAASKVTARKSMVYPINGGEAPWVWLSGPSDQITNVKSSNTKVATASATKKGLFGTQKTVSIKAKKPGTTRVSFTVKRKGKTYRLSTKVTVIKYCPFASVKVGKKDVTKGLNSKFASASGKFPGTLNIKMASGWKLKSLKIIDYSTEKSTKVKNGSDINLGEDQTLEIVVVHKKTKKKFSAFIS